MVPPCRCGLLQRDPHDHDGGRSPGEMGRLWKTLSEHHVEICDTHAVGDYRTPSLFGGAVTFSLTSHLSWLKLAPSRTLSPSRLLRCTSALIIVVHNLATSPSEGGRRSRDAAGGIHTTCRCYFNAGYTLPGTFNTLFKVNIYLVYLTVIYIHPRC